MSCGHGYHGHGCWGPGECHDERWGWGGYGYGGYAGGRTAGPGRGFGYSPGPHPFGRPGPVSREVAAAQLEAYLATLRDEVRAMEADLAEMTSGTPEAGSTPQI